MADYGITDNGFVIKRLDTIMEEVHVELTETFGFDTRLLKPSYLDVLITTFCGQIAELWETAQNSYYNMYPATAGGVNLDNAVQYGGIRRTPASQSKYTLHCTGSDGTYVREEAIVATDTSPEVRLLSASEFQITRGSCNRITVKTAVVSNVTYSVSINGTLYSYTNNGGTSDDIIAGLKAAITSDEYTLTIEDGCLVIEDTVLSRNNTIVLTDNLTTTSVTSLAIFNTEEYGIVTLPDGIASKMINNIAGFDAVTNLLTPTYGNLEETDIELRQSYIAKSALRSNTMIDSITAELLNNVAEVESASGYENETDETDERGLPPHSIEIIVDGGDETEIAQAILNKKAGGIQTYGITTVNISGVYGDTIPISFNRPEYLYTWLKVVLHGDASNLPANYSALAINSLTEDGAMMTSGSNLLTQLLNDGIYGAVSGITYIDIYCAYSNDSEFTPDSDDYELGNVIVTSRQKILIDDERIEVTFIADS